MNPLDVREVFQLAQVGQCCPIGECVKQRGHSGPCGTLEDFKRALKAAR